MKNKQSTVNKQRSIGKKVLLAISYCLLSFLFLLPSSVHAQEEATQPATQVEPTLTPVPLQAETQAAKSEKLTITAIPTRLDLEAEPGETIQAQLKVRNESDTQVVVVTDHQDFIVLDSSGTPKPVEESVSGRWALSKWLEVTPKRFLLDAGQIRTLSLSITVPEDALAGGHYAMVTHEPSTQANLDGSLSRVSQKVGTLVSVTVAGDITEDMRVTRFRAYPELAEYGPIDFETELLNISDVHVKPKGSITITNMLGKTSAVLPLEEKYIFPFVSKEYLNTWSKKWGIGKYRAELKAAYGDQGGLVDAVIYFWIIPYRLIIATLLAVYFALVARVVHKQKRLDSNDEFENVK